jgi:2-dehydropantoate 2-reductase
MRILVFGAGAVGGFVGGILTAAGVDVTLVARGAQYDALSKKGLVLEGPKSGRPGPLRVNVCRPGEEKPPYDVIFVGLKSQQLAAAAAHMVSLLARGGSIILGQNGLPYWYFEKLDSPLRGSRLTSVDPDGTLAKTIPIDSVIGGVINKPADLVEPGRIRLADQASDRLAIGELDNRITPRLKEIAAVIESAGWPVMVSDNIRLLKWRKQLSNAVLNPLAAITQATHRQIAEFEATRRYARLMMDEVLAVAASVGMKVGTHPDEMLDDVVKRVGIPSSTLQDVRAGRSLELDALTNAVIDIGRLTGVPTPNLEIVAACAGLLNRRITDDRVSFAPVTVNQAR